MAELFYFIIHSFQNITSISPLHLPLNTIKLRYDVIIYALDNSKKMT
jgi:hypothetical protein